MEQYDPRAIEEKWQRVWKDERAFEVANPSPDELERHARKTYVLEMLPYPSGDLHMGHVRNYMLGDVVAHFRRRHGFVVMRPMGFDSFGLPAENAAIKEGVHPRDETPRNVAAIRAQMERMGWAIDWNRVLATHEPEYYRWTQWLFLRFFEKGLAYRKDAPVKWCPNDQTVLANEQVVDGRCERCGAEVEARNLEQWFFKITDYADVLLDEMSLLEEWPERVLTMQRNWIGRSEGADVLFRVDDFGDEVEIFTTRPDTLFGATFFVLAPEHPLVARLVEGTDRETEVLDYVRHAGARSAVERETKEKDGIFTGRYVLNPVNRERIPIWVADYVLMEYGTGAIMAVPAHDERDFAFAERYALEIRQVVEPAEGSEAPAEGAFLAHTESERLVNSGDFSGMPAPEGGRAIVEKLAGEGLARTAIRYRLRDWLLSRQRYWGAPIPIVYCDECGIVPVPDEDLPVLLPDVDGVPAEGAVAARRRRGLGADDVSALRRRGASGDRHDGHVRRLVLVLPALRRRAQRPGAVRPRARRLLAARQPVHRRSRARDPASAVRALLREGDERSRAGRVPRAVRAALHAGDALPRRREDVEVQGERDLTGRVRRALRSGRGSHVPALHRPRRAGCRVAGRGLRGHRALPPPSLADCRGAGGEAVRRAGPRHAARPQDASHDRQGHGRHRPALRAEHADRGRDGARERDPARTRTILRRASPSRPR